MVLRLGIDVGGTNTDAVILRGREVLAGVKSATTEDVMSGISNALEAVLEKAGVAREAIDVTMIGTTHFTNAVVERKGLDQVAAIRLGLPATACLPPMVDWPEDLVEMVGGHRYLLRGGYEFDGREIAALDEDELIRIAGEITEKGIKAAAISSVFSPVNRDMEERARDILQEHCPGLPVVLSCEIGRLGLLERESAAIMNASLLSLSDRTVEAFGRALSEAGLTCPFYVTQNDGTLMAADMVRRFPVLTFASGPTNSMRGAAFLTGVKEAIVIDIGGTTTDVGSLHHGFPRQAATVVDVGGVRTNFRMPDVFSIGLGGGTMITGDADNLQIGPKSVGYRLPQEALVFGGKTLTTTDIAVRAGMAEVGDAAKVAEIDPALVEAAKAQIAEMLEMAVERSRVSPDPIPVIAVGGGSILAPDRIGDLEVLRPENFAVANAVGAAIAQISGEVDRIYALEGTTREECLANAEREASDAAVSAGAKPETLIVIEREDVPLAYLPGNATRIHLKVVGEMGENHA
ncbi:N-methylhydantoinase A/oxoprolinase/acetone carboxylase, beta subunit [Mameliella alba]|uniref:hydantoinase/oxoprolinase N-terminal domain-containing protein n=1 Tax=Mameliella TaxID=1434019 RepID=UPI00088CB6D4|nr:MULTISPECIES: hydantoinase/oxoprolinase family protein [Mameliella]MCR9272857.1 hydantoinase/oxoprolinase family protein [Paracoccaceae bacterium]OWV42723.1 hydantoinase subunit beta [Mameliella alba]OWV57402.1 hydantoinase subunit beta [Mameliella alba]PTR35912.1 N-methylhydantoinase A/oxoprolinase/acetone carboxylase beta subunit [Mameliella alba]SDE07120.1 N-methylhydantoinase A/oxoprolinase/acetone carboxylase, beta subunit [Mameliella alba]